MMFGCDDDLLRVMAKHGEECTLIDKHGRAVVHGHLKHVSGMRGYDGEYVRLEIVGLAGAALEKWTRRRADR